MLPFLVGQVQITKSDGTVVRIGGDKSSDQSNGDSSEENSSTTTHTGTPSKHAKHSSSDGMDGTVVPIVAIVFVFLWLIIKALMAPFTQRNARRAATTGGTQALSEEEQAVLLKLQRTIVQMEQRIESLETILIDEHRTKEKYGTKI